MLREKKEKLKAEQSCDKEESGSAHHRLEESGCGAGDVGGGGGGSGSGSAGGSGGSCVDGAGGDGNIDRGLNSESEVNDPASDHLRGTRCRVLRRDRRGGGALYHNAIVSSATKCMDSDDIEVCQWGKGRGEEGSNGGRREGRGDREVRRVEVWVSRVSREDREWRVEEG